MPFVKLDQGILNSTLWFQKECRDLFITALLMAEPHELRECAPQLEGTENGIRETGFVVPPGWYGFVRAAGPGLCRVAVLDNSDVAMAALKKLGEPDPESRSHEFDGRRLVRVDGGYIVLNFIKYREKDATTADRSRRWRERQKAKGLLASTSRVADTPTRVIRHQAEAEAEAEAYKKEEAIKPSRAARSVSLPLCISQTDWDAYCKHRGAKFTDHAKKLAIAKLEEWNRAGQNPNEILRQSTMNGWKGLFEVKARSRDDERQRVIDGLTGRKRERDITPIA